MQQTQENQQFMVTYDLKDSTLQTGKNGNAHSMYEPSPWS